MAYGVCKFKTYNLHWVLWDTQYKEVGKCTYATKDVRDWLSKKRSSKWPDFLMFIWFFCNIKFVNPVGRYQKSLPVTLINTYKIKGVQILFWFQVQNIKITLFLKSELKEGERILREITYPHLPDNDFF